MKTTRQKIDELIEKQKWAAYDLERSELTGLKLWNAQQRYHRIDAQIEKLCRESGERREA